MRCELQRARDELTLRRGGEARLAHRRAGLPPFLQLSSPRSGCVRLAPRLSPAPQRTALRPLARPSRLVVAPCARRKNHRPPAPGRTARGGSGGRLDRWNGAGTEERRAVRGALWARRAGTSGPANGRGGSIRCEALPRRARSLTLVLPTLALLYTAKSKNHTNHNQNKVRPAPPRRRASCELLLTSSSRPRPPEQKAHKNGLKKPASTRERYANQRGVSPSSSFRP